MESEQFQIERKAIVDDIANRFIKIFSLGRFRRAIERFVRANYDKGVKEIEKQLDFNVSFGDQMRDTEMLKEYTFDNISGITDEIQNKLRQELQRGLMGNETQEELRRRVADIFRGDNPTRFRFQDRIRMIVRTEGKRAANMAKFANAQKLGRPLFKYIKIIRDHRTSDICKAEAAKYGTKAEAIPLDEEFSVHTNGKEYRANYPPFHPNCRSSVIITQDRRQDK